MRVQGSKLRLTGHQCDQKLSARFFSARFSELVASWRLTFCPITQNVLCFALFQITEKNTISKPQTYKPKTSVVLEVFLVLSSYLIMAFLACIVTFQIMFLCKLYNYFNMLATKICDLATKFFPLVTSCLLSKKVIFEPWRPNGLWVSVY